MKHLLDMAEQALRECAPRVSGVALAKATAALAAIASAATQPPSPQPEQAVSTPAGTQEQSNG